MTNCWHWWMPLSLPRQTLRSSHITLALLADAVDVPLSQIAAADKAIIVSGDDVKIIVEGCPDGRNIWTYIIDPYTGKAYSVEGKFLRIVGDKERE